MRMLSLVSLTLMLGFQVNLHAQSAADSVATPVESETRSTKSTTRQIDSLELGSTVIKGNAELPKVLYIVPWQSAGAGDLDGRPMNSLLDQVLAPVDRDVFLRQVDYFEQLSASPVTDGATN
jgi:hypothetical protein